MIMLEHNLSQKDEAKKLYVTEPAISQYVKNKRAKEVKINEKVREEMKKSVDRIMKNPAPQIVIVELQRILSVMKKEMILCDLHRKMDANIPLQCNECQKWW